ncbi:hypothetical protein DCM91_13515 [Chitinophaga costaii]|nr:hypothetical protein DCM91_13515 [Chitinophaga costaii]
MQEGKWPLIPDVADLTKYIKDKIDKETSVIEGAPRSLADIYSQLIEEVIKTGKTNLINRASPANQIALEKLRKLIYRS